MIRYTQEQKNEALNKMEEIGAKKTQKELGISVQTLYKWRSEMRGEAVVSKKSEPAKVDVSVSDLLKDDALENKLKRLEAENAHLIEQNLKLKKALLSFVEV